MSTDISPSNLERLTFIHIRRYGRQLRLARLGYEGYSAEENTMYLKLWDGISRKKYQWNLLSEEEKGEVQDALDDEEDWGTCEVEDVANIG